MQLDGGVLGPETGMVHVVMAIQRIIDHSTVCMHSIKQVTQHTHNSTRCVHGGKNKLANTTTMFIIVLMHKPEWSPASVLENVCTAL